MQVARLGAPAPYGRALGNPTEFALQKQRVFAGFVLKRNRDFELSCFGFVLEPEVRRVFAAFLKRKIRKLSKDRQSESKTIKSLSRKAEKSVS